MSMFRSVMSARSQRSLRDLSANDAFVRDVRGLEAPRSVVALKGVSGMASLLAKGGGRRGKQMAQDLFALSTGVAQQVVAAALSGGKVDARTAQALRHVVYNYASVGQRDAVVYHALAPVLCSNAGSLEPKDLSLTLWSFAKAGFFDLRVFDAVGVEVERRAGELNAQALANSVWSYATAGFAHRGVFDAVGAEVERRAGEMNAQNLANSAWAYALSWVLYPEVVGKASIARVVGACAGELAMRQRQGGAPLSVLTGRQLVQVRAVLMGDRVLVDLPAGTRGFLDGEAARLADGVVEPMPSSDLHGDVSRTLSEMGVGHDTETVVDLCGARYQVDVLLDAEVGGSKVVIEVDGPHHYYRPAGRGRGGAGVHESGPGNLRGGGDSMVTAKTRAKRALLAKAGYRALSVPYFEWRRLKTAARRRAYLEDLMSS